MVVCERLGVLAAIRKPIQDTKRHHNIRNAEAEIREIIAPDNTDNNTGNSLTIASIIH
jgi:hypothetical protein